MTKALQAKVNQTYYERVEKAASDAGYPNVSEFVRSAVAEKMTKLEGYEAESDIEQARRQIGSKAGD